MFTGIITDVARVLDQKTEKGGLTLTFQKPKSWTDLRLGESVATSGVCLTVTDIRPDSYDCHLMAETLKISAFGSGIPKAVNLERSLSARDRFGGHFVQGHVDGVGTVTKIDQTDGYYITIEFPVEAADLVIYKGSITINGVSLTVTDVKHNKLSVALIPHTLEHTTLDSLKEGDTVNLEFDMIGKYVARIMSLHGHNS
jgi:riboflavin synthase